MTWPGFKPRAPGRSRAARHNQYRAIAGVNSKEESTVNSNSQSGVGVQSTSQTDPRKRKGPRCLVAVWHQRQRERFKIKEMLMRGSE